MSGKYRRNYDPRIRQYQYQGAVDEMMLAAAIMITCSIPFVTIFIVEMAWAFLSEGRELPWKAAWLALGISTAIAVLLFTIGIIIYA